MKPSALDGLFRFQVSDLVRIKSQTYMVDNPNNRYEVIYPQVGQIISRVLCERAAGIEAYYEVRTSGGSFSHGIVASGALTTFTEEELVAATGVAVQCQQTPNSISGGIAPADGGTHERVLDETLGGSAP